MANESEELIEGKCKVDGTILTIYILGLPISELPYDLEVFILAEKQVRTS